MGNLGDSKAKYSSVFYNFDTLTLWEGGLPLTSQYIDINHVEVSDFPPNILSMEEADQKKLCLLTCTVRCFIWYCNTFMHVFKYSNLITYVHGLSLDL